MKSCECEWRICSVIKDFGKCYMNDLEKINAITCFLHQNPKNNINKWDELEDGDAIETVFYNGGVKCGNVGIIEDGKFNFIIWGGKHNSIWENWNLVHKTEEIKTIEKLQGGEAEEVRKLFKEVRNRYKKIEQQRMF